MKLISIAASFFAFASLVACNSSSSTPGGGSNGACTLSTGGTVTSCSSWTNLSSSDTSALCPTSSNSGYALVSTCPTADQVGACTTTVSAGGVTYTYVDTFYSANGNTCADAKQACSAGSVSGSGITTSFSGNGC